jgi:hypothetical protein
MDKFKNSANAQRAAFVSFVSVVSVVLLGAGSAFATTSTDPLGGAGDSFFTDLKDYLTGNLIPAVIGLAVIGVAVGMLIKWGKKGSKAA